MIQVLIKECKETFRDKANLFFILLFPSLLVCLLGNLLTFMDKADNTVGSIDIAYVVETTDPAGVASIESFLESMAGNSSIHLQQTSDIEQAKAQVSAGELTAAVVFEQPLRVSLFEGSDHTKNRALQSVFTAFSQTAGAVNTVLHNAPEQVHNLSTGESESSFVQQKDLGVNRTMLDYYAVAMTVMILFMGGMGGALSFQLERKGGTVNRLFISPKNKVSLYLQKVLGAVPQAVLQVGIVMLTSTLLFGAHYAASWQHNLLLFSMFFVCGLSVIAVCSIVGLFLRANAMLVLMPIFWAVMFISGTFSKEIYIEGLTPYSPIYLIQNAAFDLTVFGRTGQALTVLGVCAVLFVAALGIGAAIFSKRGEKL